MYQLMQDNIINIWYIVIKTGRRGKETSRFQGTEDFFTYSHSQNET